MMKRAAILLSLLIFVGCSETTGPAGPQGPPGDALVGQGFEVEANFTPQNDYAEFFSFPNSAEVLDTDIVLVYWLFSVNEQTGNDVWQQLPASVFFDDGAQLQYSFDHTLNDVQLYLTGDVDLTTVGEGYTREQIFRVAILPVDYVQTHNIDVKNMDEVMQAVGKNQFKKMDLEKK